MKVSFLFHLYQPSFQTEAVFRDIFNKSYNPLLKLIKTHKNFKVTLNTPLSLLEQMDKYGYTSWIEDIKDLVNTEQVEITGSAAYHSLLTKIPTEIAEKEIILNEYGLGYYYGRRSGFEGEPSVLIKDLNGLFPPELATNMEVLNILDTMGYKWLLCDETALPQGSSPNLNYYGFNDLDIKLVVRDRDLSNMISFKRDLNTDDVFAAIKSQQKNHCVIALDGETFGHHFKEGVLWLESLVEQFSMYDIETFLVSELNEEIDDHNLTTIVESTWGASASEMAQGDVYPMWDVPGNAIHKKQWEFIAELAKFAPEIGEFTSASASYESIPVWKLGEETDPILKASKQNVEFLKLFNSDQFWWSSNKTLPFGKTLYDKGILAGIISTQKTYIKTYIPENDNFSLLTKLDDLEKTI